MPAPAQRFALICLFATSLMYIGGCSALKKAATGGKQTNSDLKREGDKAYKSKATLSRLAQ